MTREEKKMIADLLRQIIRFLDVSIDGFKRQRETINKLIEVIDE